MKGKTAFISGASRGIGKAIALRLASEGANIIVAAKTAEPHPKLKGTIYSAAEEIENAGGKALPLIVDIRHEDVVQDAFEKAVDKFGGIDILINNASAISLTDSQTTTMKRYDLMHTVNGRGTFMVTKYAVPHLKQGTNPHILTLSPPLNLNPKWFTNYMAYTMSKYNMSMTVLGYAEELREHGIAANALWPQTGIATAAIEFGIGGKDMMQICRTTDIMADAANVILNRDSKTCTGNFFIDEDVMRSEGVTDFEMYAVNPDKELMKDLFID